MKKITQRGISFEYEYDSRGNITSEKRSDLTTTYQYDALGQMIRVNDPHGNATWVYNYDRGGNITSKVKYAYTTGAVGTAVETIPYVYGDSNWKDKLTSYDGQTITCDEIGNPTNDGIWSYTWEAGRQLKQMSTEGASVSFKYGHNGMHVQKVVEQSWYPETTNYTMHGKFLAHMTVDYTDFDEVAHQDKLHFFYDAQSRPAKVSYNGTMYTYALNGQGDVAGLLDNSGNLVVEYQYNAWGTLQSMTGTLVDTLGRRNPLRYHGYIYDEETELYYLQSRYYSPTLQRLINADAAVNLDEDLLAHNLFTYCLNDPINRSDESGSWSLPNWAKVAIGAALVVTAAVVATVATGGVACFAAGAAKGAVSGAIGGAVTGAISNRIRTGSWEGSLEAAVDGAADGFMYGAISGFIMGGLSSKACFVAGTLISAAHGLKPIETIQSDEFVWAEDPQTGERALKRVVRTFLNEKDALVHVQVNGETITCTTEHPFYVWGKGWVAAEDLKIGDRLELQNGANAFIEAVHHEKLAKPIQVYNFEVEDFHTYYVGPDCVLVHNVCAQNASKHGHYEIDYSNGTKYVGKGSPARMNVSARQHTFDSSRKTVRTVVNKKWYPSASNDMAFVDEYRLMKAYGFGNRDNNLLNKIQSPCLKKAIRMRIKI